MAVKNPTNRELVTLLTTNHKEIVHRLEKVEEQVKLTNGRVKDLEMDKERRTAVEEFKAQQKPQPVATTEQGNIVVQPPATYWASKEKLYGALAALAVAIAALIGVYTR